MNKNSLEYFDFDGTCSPLVKNPSDAYMDGNVFFAFAVKEAVGENFRFVTGRGKEEFTKLLYNDAKGIKEAPQAFLKRKTQISKAKKEFDSFVDENPNIEKKYPNIKQKVNNLLKGSNLAKKLEQKSCITDHGEVLTIGKNDEELKRTLKAKNIKIPENNIVDIPRTNEENQQMKEFISGLHKSGKSFIKKLCQKHGLTTNNNEENFVAVEYKTASFGVNFNSIEDVEKAKKASDEVKSFLEKNLKKAPKDMFTLEQEEAKEGKPPVFEIRSTASKGKALKSFGLLKDGITFYGDSFGKVTSYDGQKREIRTGGTDRSVGKIAQNKGVKINIIQVASHKDKVITNPDDCCYPKHVFSSPAQLGGFMQKSIKNKILENSKNIEKQQQPHGFNEVLKNKLNQR